MARYPHRQEAQAGLKTPPRPQRQMRRATGRCKAQPLPGRRFCHTQKVFPRHQATPSGRSIAKHRLPQRYAGLLDRAGRICLLHRRLLVQAGYVLQASQVAVSVSSLVANAFGQ